MTSPNQKTTVVDVTDRENFDYLKTRTWIDDIVDSAKQLAEIRHLVNDARHGIEFATARLKNAGPDPGASIAAALRCLAQARSFAEVAAHFLEKQIDGSVDDDDAE